MSHEIKTIADLARLVTIENVDELAADLKQFLVHTAIAKGLVGIGADAAGLPYNPERLGVVSLVWTEDGKGECHTTVAAAGATEADPRIEIHSKPNPAD